jgi:hypothetical protein
LEVSFSSWASHWKRAHMHWLSAGHAERAVLGRREVSYIKRHIANHIFLNAWLRSSIISVFINLISDT